MNPLNKALFNSLKPKAPGLRVIKRSEIESVLTVCKCCQVPYNPKADPQHQCPETELAYLIGAEVLLDSTVQITEDEGVSK